MPMYDFACMSCQSEFERFFHRAQSPEELEAVRCDQCGGACVRMPSVSRIGGEFMRRVGARVDARMKENEVKRQERLRAR